MVNYQLGKIYKIVDNTNGNIYIGSTCEKTLARRLQTHMTDYKKYLKGEKKSNTALQIFKNNNYNIILIENYPCENKDVLHARERHYIETLICVNYQRPGRTPKEYKEENKDKVEEYYKRYNIDNKGKVEESKKKYYLKNKESIIEKNKLFKTLCSCGMYRNGHKARHEQTKFHQNYILNNPI